MFCANLLTLNANLLNFRDDFGQISGDFWTILADFSAKLPQRPDDGSDWEVRESNHWSTAPEDELPEVETVR